MPRLDGIGPLVNGPIPVALVEQIERLQGPLRLREIDTLHEASWKG
jgi:hypothetical protein